MSSQKPPPSPLVAESQDSSSTSNHIPRQQQNISYETYAPRSTSQRGRLEQIEKLTCGPIFSSDNLQKKEDTKGPSMIVLAMSPPGRGKGGSIAYYDSESMSDAERRIQTTLKGCHSEQEELKGCMADASSLQKKLRHILSLSEELESRHSELVRRSGEVSSAAEQLQEEELMLSQHAEEIGMPLKHYDAVDRICIGLGVLFKHKARTVVAGIPKVKVDAKEFEKMLEEIDDAVMYFGGREGIIRERKEAEREHGGEGSMNEQENNVVEYSRKAVALQGQALAMIHEAVVDRITTCTNDICEVLNSNTSKANNAPQGVEKLEASLIYTRFHGISARCNHLIRILKKFLRSRNRHAHQHLLDLARTTYCSCRETLLKLALKNQMEHFKQLHGLVGMIRIASVFFIKLCSIETDLFLDFFSDYEAPPVTNGQPTPSAEHEGDTIERSAKQKTKQKHLQTKSRFKTAYQDTLFQNTLLKLCSPFYKTLRRNLLTISDLDTLCQIVAVLREEQNTANASRTSAAAGKVIANVISDAQERLIFCANSAVRKDVIKFVPTPQDIDYPNKLIQPSQPQALQRTTSETTNNAAPPAADALTTQLLIYDSWFPPIRSVLRVLSKIFRVVEPRVFEDIALQAVQSCSKSLKEASMQIMAEHGILHSDLFLVKHLLILREQLSPFDIQLRSVERQLDFSEAGKAVSRFLANRNRQLFSMSTQNSLISLLREGVSVQESSVDSKRDLEDALRSACNDFIEHTSASLADPILKFALQCKLLEKEASKDVIRSQEFLHAVTMQQNCEETLQNMPGVINEVISQMSIYLDNVATQSILWKPVTRKISRAVDDAERFIKEITVDGEYGWDAEIRKEVEQKMKEIDACIKDSSSKLIVRQRSA